MKQFTLNAAASNGRRPSFFFALTLLVCCVIFSPFFLPDEAAGADDSAEAFLSATFGLSAARTQKRMERSGAVAFDYIRNGRLSMKGTFEYRSAIFVFNFHAKRGLNHKSVYLASSGDAAKDRALYDGLRAYYNLRFGETEEQVGADVRSKGKITLQSIWRPNKDTNVLLTYNPQLTDRFPGNSLQGRPICLAYTYSKWDS